MGVVVPMFNLRTRVARLAEVRRFKVSLGCTVRPLLTENNAQVTKEKDTQNEEA